MSALDSTFELQAEIREHEDRLARLKAEQSRLEDEHERLKVKSDRFFAAKETEAESIETRFSQELQALRERLTAQVAACEKEVEMNGDESSLGAMQSGIQKIEEEAKKIIENKCKLHSALMQTGEVEFKELEESFSNLGKLKLKNRLLIDEEEAWIKEYQAGEIDNLPLMMVRQAGNFLTTRAQRLDLEARSSLQSTALLVARLSVVESVSPRRESAAATSTTVFLPSGAASSGNGSAGVKAGDEGMPLLS